MKTKTLIFKIEGMHCTSCAMNIDLDLEDIEGIQNSNTNYAKSISVVQTDEKINPEIIIEQIKKTGYYATIE